MNTLKRVSTAEAVVHYFIEEIEAGNLKQGAQLASERKLQEQFGISRFSLREGLARLSALGIIQIKHGKGAFISGEINIKSLGHVLLPMFSDSTKGSLNDLSEARVLIEERTAELAALRRSAEDVEALREILLQSERALHDPITFGEFDYQFHHLIAQASGNVFFQKMLDVMNDYIHSFLQRHAEDYHSRKSALKNHWQIFDCIEKKDEKNISPIMNRHICSCMENYIKHMLNQQKVQ